jgi:release factor glutamine methyltransferase
MEVTPSDIAALAQDKYDGDRDSDITEDLKRLAGGEPLAYVIGWIPFLNLKVWLGTPNVARPLIPRPETEWWTEKLIEHLKYKFEDRPFTLLDLCAGSGAIGLAVLSAFPQARVSFGEIDPELKSGIQKNLEANMLDATRSDIRTGDLFTPFGNERFDVIATNPPYIPQVHAATLEKGVTDFEPHQALFSGADGLGVIRKITAHFPKHLSTNGELWMECDISNIEAAEKLIATNSPNLFESSIHMDQYNRPRLLICVRM